MSVPCDEKLHTVILSIMQQVTTMASHLTHFVLPDMTPKIHRGVFEDVWSCAIKLYLLLLSEMCGAERSGSII